MGLFSNKRRASSTVSAHPPLITLTDTQSEHPEQFTTLSPLQVRRPSASLRDLEARAYERWVNEERPRSFSLRSAKKPDMKNTQSPTKRAKASSKAKMPESTDKAALGGRAEQVEDISSLSAPTTTQPVKATLALPPGALPKDGYVASLRRSDRKKTKTTSSFDAERERRYSLTDEIGMGMGGIVMRT